MPFKYCFLTCPLAVVMLASIFVSSVDAASIDRIRYICGRILRFWWSDGVVACYCRLEWEVYGGDTIDGINFGAGYGWGYIVFPEITTYRKWYSAWMVLLISPAATNSRWMSLGLIAEAYLEKHNLEKIRNWKIILFRGGVGLKFFQRKSCGRGIWVGVGYNLQKLGVGAELSNIAQKSFYIEKTKQGLGS